MKKRFERRTRPRVSRLLRLFTAPPHFNCQTFSMYQICNCTVGNFKISAQLTQIFFQCCHICQCGNECRCPATEFNGIGNQNFGSGLCQNRFCHLHFPMIKIQQSAIFIDSRDANDSIIHFELPEHIHSRRANDAAIRFAQCAACNGQINAARIRQNIRYIQLICDDH